MDDEWLALDCPCSLCTTPLLRHAAPSTTQAANSRLAAPSAQRSVATAYRKGLTSLLLPLRSSSSLRPNLPSSERAGRRGLAPAGPLSRLWTAGLGIGMGLAGLGAGLA